MLLILILILLFGGLGGGYYGYNRGWGGYVSPGNPAVPPRYWVGPGPWAGGLPVIVAIIIVYLLVSSGRF